MEKKIVLFSIDDPLIDQLSTSVTDPQFMVEKGLLTGEGSKNPLDSLTPRQRQILWLKFHPDRFGQAHTIQAIGEKIGFSERTVKRELRAALTEIPDPSKLYSSQR
ncbi:hypothetical protein A2867_01680 [Candidatus Daviesbacteria bacterium RIFCSPHIGHO2_01_FULL_40_11]|uniref:RNA polymerase sigma-70 region 4 domain-containing protein n=1 Tax=Candidatus Daviesbacteria bacterium RIFCSPHIGHO2_01_FULL_40_11 TaxID=1797762 RepID=A0A1F5JLZ8_9BACT|nr:MAG: hypothetical protein A2867_01680 [Candidatus Daviesbacteria bacterium RIFCSPHIGHO2_01_FULL_40_11]OGE62991.1 MAG: hypothetical protein A2964_02115 [Candidatus Daviesbacteria bacterium RIFCSPLOWO2_01_FULL_40_27]